MAEMKAHRNAAFALPPERRDAVFKWIGETQQFIRDALAYEEETLLVSRQLYSGTGYSATGVVAADEDAPEFDAGKAETTAPDATVGERGVVEMAPPSGFGPHALSTVASNWFGSRLAVQSKEVMESLVLQYAVQLVINMDHYGTAIRQGALRQLLSLARALGATAAQLERADEWDGRVTAEPGPALFALVGEVFAALASVFSGAAVALVASLETFYVFEDGLVRGMCVSAAAQLILAHAPRFTDPEDHSCALWNLHFALSFLSDARLWFSDRVVLVEACGTLAPLFAGGPLPLRLAETLLRLRGKTAAERQAVQTALGRIFDACSLSTILAADGLAASVYGVFLAVIDTHNEYADDLLGWAVQRGTEAALEELDRSKHVQNSNVRKEMLQKRDRVHATLAAFARALTGYYQAAPPLVRYGACLCLHAAVSVYPNLVRDWPQIWEHVGAGLFDMDPLVASMYLSIVGQFHLPVLAGTVEVVGAPAPKSVTDMIATMRLSDETAPAESPASGRFTLAQVLHATLRHAPPPSRALLGRLCSALEYLPRSQRLRQLELIRAWCSRLEQFDSLVVQAVLPLLEALDGETQLAALQVVAQVVPLLARAPAADVAYAWGYFRLLVRPKQRPALLAAALECLHTFPIVLLAPEARSELVSALHQLTFHASPQLRRTAYTLLQRAAVVLGDGELALHAWTALLLSLGEQDRGNLLMLAAELRSSASPYATVLGPGLQALEQTVQQNEQLSPVALVAAFDELADLVVAPGSDAAPVPLGTVAGTELPQSPLPDAVVRALRSERASDPYWWFFLHDVPDTQLVKPDDYDYDRNLIHSPLFVALLYCKLRTTPPPLRIQNAPPRSSVPTAPAGRRRFVCGFLTCILPTAGIPDPLQRQAACHALVRCCFRRQRCNTAMLRGLLEFVAQQMLVHKQWTFHASALALLHQTARLRLPGLSQALAAEYLDVALDMAANRPTLLVRLAALDFCEAALLLFPQGLAPRAAELRDCLRALMIDKETTVADRAAQVYPLVFRAPGAPEYVAAGLQLVRADVRALQLSAQAPTTLGDPLLAALTGDERERVLGASLRSLGLVPLAAASTGGNEHSAEPPRPFLLVQECLFPLLEHRNAAVRTEAARAVLRQRRGFSSDDDRHVAGWLLLPLLADASPAVRRVFADELANVPGYEARLAAQLAPHVDDAPFLAPTTWAELLDEGAAPASVSKRLLAEMGVCVADAASVAPRPTDAAALFQLLERPVLVISDQLIARFRHGLSELAGPLPADRAAAVLYYLQRAAVRAPDTLLALALFTCAHESPALEPALDVLMQSVALDVGGDTRRAVEAGILALRLLSELSPAAFRALIQRFAAPGAAAGEGEVLALLYLSPQLAASYPSRAVDLLRKYLPLITNARYPARARLHMVHACAELVAPCGAEQAVRLLDAIQAFVETLPPDDAAALRPRALTALERVLRVAAVGSAGSATRPHLFKGLVAATRRDVLSANADTRRRGLATLRLVARSLAPDDTMRCALPLLADPEPDVRAAVLATLAGEGALAGIADDLRAQMRADPVLCGTRVVPRVPVLTAAAYGDAHRPTPAALALPSAPSGKPPAGALAPGKLETMPALPALDPLDLGLDVDALNARYYASAARKKWARHFGLPETRFAAAAEPPERSVLAVLAERSLAASGAAGQNSGAGAPASAGAASDMQRAFGWIAQVDPFLVLRQCVRSYPAIAKELADACAQNTVQWLNALVGAVVAPLAAAPAAPGPAGEAPQAGEAAATPTPRPVESVSDGPGRVVHETQLLANLTLAADGVAAFAPQTHVDTLQAVLAKANAAAERLRELLAEDLESPFLFEELPDVPITSDAQFALFEEHDALCQDAKLDVLRTGNAEKFVELERRRRALEHNLATHAHQLQQCTMLATQALLAVGQFYCYATSPAPDAWLAWFSVLVGLAGGQHRGQRAAAADLLAAMTHVFFINLPTSPTDPAHVGAVQAAVGNAVAAAVAQVAAAAGGRPLFRLPAHTDAFLLMARLVPHVASPELRREVLWALVGAWRSPDSDTRAVAIALVDQLVCANSADARTALVRPASAPVAPRLAAEIVDDVEAGSGEAAAALVKATIPDLTREITSLLLCGDYPDKPALDALLQRKLDYYAAAA